MSYGFPLSCSLLLNYHVKQYTHTKLVNVALTATVYIFQLLLLWLTNKKQSTLHTNTEEVILHLQALVEVVCSLCQ